MSDSVTAFAPASIGNVGVGFDMLGLALEGVGDRVSARRTDGPGISLADVRGLNGEPHPHLSTDPKHNTASTAAQALWDDFGGDGGAELKVYDSPLDLEKLLPYALEGEKYASGSMNADNVAPSLMGGLILCPEVLLPDMFRVPVPDGVSAVLVHPELQVNTAQARRRLAKGYSMEQWLSQQGYFAGFLTACATNDIALIGKTLKDVIIEPQRAAAVACFDAVKEAAQRGGALGVSLSGSGPSIFALCEDNVASNLAVAMEQACRGQGIDCQSWVSPMNAPGAYVEA